MEKTITIKITNPQGKEAIMTKTLDTEGKSEATLANELIESINSDHGLMGIKATRVNKTVRKLNFKKPKNNEHGNTGINSEEGQ